MTDEISLGSIRKARETIAPWISPTPVVQSQALSSLDSRVFLKLETVHDIRAFKIRGATNFVQQLSAQDAKRGVVTVSTGNHGRAVALAAQRAGIKATVCMSELVPSNKIDAVRALGAEVIVGGQSQDDAEQTAKALCDEAGKIIVHPFDDPHIVSGQGTIGLELAQQLETVDHVIVGLSGGGLAAGIAVALKALQPKAKVTGVSMEKGPAMYRSIQAGRPILVEEEPTLADSLGGGIGLDNRYTFDLVQQYVDDHVLLTEDEIMAGMRHLYWKEGLVVEGGGSVPVAALVANKIVPLRGNVACIVSGSNIDMQRFTDIVSRANP